MSAPWQVVNADVIEWAKSYDGPPFHAALLDPPYHLTSITKRFGKPNSAPANGDVYRRASAGFMGQEWDGGDISFRPETWAALGQHLYPGAFGMAFASSRGWHRMAVAIEDAGLTIHPTIWIWVQGQGFPKSARIPDGRFSGYRYGGQAMKPAVEPVILFQKPYQGRPVDNITQTGAGALNIDRGRIPLAKGESVSVGYANSKRNGVHNEHEGWMRPWKLDVEYYASKIEARVKEVNQKGRWPSNLLIHHNPTCTPDACAQGCPVERLGEQAGPSVARPVCPENIGKSGDGSHKGLFGNGSTVQSGYYDDDDSVSRFFFQPDWHYEILEQLENADPVYYTAKASKTEREAGLDNLPTQTRNRVNSGGLENEPRFAPTQVKNNHPTVKSISLTKYLAGLLLPPDAYAPRRILTPFCGSGSEMIGAVLAGFEEATGIEQSAHYCDIARARLTWWSDWLRWGQRDVETILAATTEQEPEGQLSFIDLATAGGAL